MKKSFKRMLSLALVLALCLSCVPALNVSAAESGAKLLVSYTMDAADTYVGNDGKVYIKDTSGNGYDAVVQNTYSAKGVNKDDGALGFRGDLYGSIVDRVYVDEEGMEYLNEQIGDSYTYSFWMYNEKKMDRFTPVIGFYRDTTTTEDVYAGVLEIRYPSTLAFGAHMKDKGGIVQNGDGSYTYVNPGDGKCYFATMSTYNAWNHFVFVREGSSVSVYINGTQVQDKASLSGSLGIDNLSSFEIGGYVRRNWVDSNVRTRFQGMIDDVRIYGGALTAEQAIALYTNGAADSTSAAAGAVSNQKEPTFSAYDGETLTESDDPIVHLTMDGVENGTVADQSGNGIDAMATDYVMAIANQDKQEGRALFFDGFSDTEQTKLMLDKDDTAWLSAQLNETGKATVSFWMNAAYENSHRMALLGLYGTDGKPILTFETRGQLGQDIAMNQKFAIAVTSAKPLEKGEIADEKGSEQLAITDTTKDGSGNFGDKSTNTWYHVVGELDQKAGTMTLYINGEKVQTVEIADGSLAEIGYFMVGQPATRYYQYENANNSNETNKNGWSMRDGYVGTIDDIQIFNTTLSDSYVAALYKTGTHFYEAGVSGDVVKATVYAEIAEADAAEAQDKAGAAMDAARAAQQDAEEAEELAVQYPDDEAVQIAAQQAANHAAEAMAQAEAAAEAAASAVENAQTVSEKAQSASDALGEGNEETAKEAVGKALTAYETAVEKVAEAKTAAAAAIEEAETAVAFADQTKAAAKDTDKLPAAQEAEQIAKAAAADALAAKTAAETAASDAAKAKTEAAAAQIKAEEAQAAAQQAQADAEAAKAAADEAIANAGANATAAEDAKTAALAAAAKAEEAKAAAATAEENAQQAQNKAEAAEAGALNAQAEAEAALDAAQAAAAAAEEANVAAAKEAAKAAQEAASSAQTAAAATTESSKAAQELSKAGVSAGEAAMASAESAAYAAAAAQSAKEAQLAQKAAEDAQAKAEEAQAEAEEAQKAVEKAALAGAKYQAVLNLDTTAKLVDKSGYTVEQIQALAEAVSAAKTAIGEAETLEAVQKALDAGKAAIAAVKDMKPANPFVDIKEDMFCYDAVLWAYNSKITTGKDESHFDPFGKCTREQVVTFLWRAAGSPEPTTQENPFTDVTEGTFYYDAVLWAVEEGVTKGMTDTLFGTEQPCTRAQVATFLWRAMGEPEAVSALNPFTDVTEGTFYYDAVLWAVEEGITNGVDKTTFGPDEACSRDQIVTFLYRNYAK